MALQVAPPPIAEVGPPPMPPGAGERMLAERRAAGPSMGGGLSDAIKDAGEKVLALARERPDLAEDASNVMEALTALLEKSMQPPAEPPGAPEGMPPGGRPPMPPPMMGGMPPG